MSTSQHNEEGWSLSMLTPPTEQTPLCPSDDANDGLPPASARQWDVPVPVPVPDTDTPTKHSQQCVVDTQSSRPAGVQYCPGTYPTPDLLPFPAGRYRILDQTESFTSVTIQSALDSLGEYATLYLPQGSRWAVSSAVTLKSHQELATWGYPMNEDQMAVLEAESTCKQYILRCDGTSDVRIRNLRIEGGRERFGRDNGCWAIVYLGQSGECQTIDRCILRNTRGWASCHVKDGAKGIRVTNNLIGPSGHSSDIDPGKKWASGIGYAGWSGLIGGNLIYDATYAAILLFGACGTLVTSNLIVIQKRHGIVGIEMTQLKSDPGRSEWTRVIYNTIRVKGSYLKVGIAQGYGCIWKADRTTFPDGSFGGTAMHNLVESEPLNAERPGAVGFGFAVAKVKSWTCTDNVSAPGVVYRGVFPASGPSPTPFIRSAEIVVDNSDTDTSIPHNKLQKEFVEGVVEELWKIKEG